MLAIQTFDAKAGGNVLYKAFAHPLVAERMASFAHRLAEAGPLAVYDPDGVADALWSLNPVLPAPTECYVHDVEQVGCQRIGLATRPLTAVAGSEAATLLIAGFDTARIEARIAPLLPAGLPVVSLDAARLPEAMLTNPRRTLDRLNYATNFAFFRDADGLSTRLVTANYWATHGARAMRLWLRLYDGAGAVLAEWEQPLPETPGGIVIDSRVVRARFGLPAFTGQLFIHAIGAAGHDVVKYALDTYGHDGEPSLSVTHDANAWPSDRYAGLPAPRADERVTLWLQNSHAVPIPAGAISLDRMGAEQPVALEQAVPPFASVAIDVAAVLPGLRWPAQIELRSGRHVVRPRYEVERRGRTRIAHMNVERADLRPDPGLASLSPLLGRGHILPFPILPRARFRSVVLPTPMAETKASLPLPLELFDREGRAVASRFLGNLPRRHALAVDLEDFDVEAGHAELAYDFTEGGEADGWLHALVRYEDRQTGHAAESSFGSHIFNTAMTYRDEPQSYAGPPPGLSTRLFLKLGDTARRSFAALIYPASAPWRARSQTVLILHDADGQVLAEQPLSLACSGSALVFPHEAFGPAMAERAEEGGYVIVRDTTCRLFGYHGLMTADGAFSLDHMFGF